MSLQKTQRTRHTTLQMSLHKHREQDIPVSRCHYTNTENKTHQSPDVITQNTENKTYQSPDVITQNTENKTYQSPDVITQTQRTRHTSLQMSLHKHREQDIPVSRCHYTKHREQDIPVSIDVITQTQHREQYIPVTRCHYTNTDNKTYQSSDIITQTQITRHTSLQMPLHKHREQDIPVSRCHYTNTENKTYQSPDVIRVT